MVLARIALRLLAVLAGLVVLSATSLTRHRIGERLGMCAGLVPGCSQHEDLLAPASA
jgi:hypothetical protein